MRGEDKILYTKESVLENNFLFFSFLSESIWYGLFGKVDTLEVPAL